MRGRMGVLKIFSAKVLAYENVCNSVHQRQGVFVIESPFTSEDLCDKHPSGLEDRRYDSQRCQDELGLRDGEKEEMLFFSRLSASPKSISERSEKTQGPKALN